MAPIDETVTIKRYASRRLYQIGTATYLKLENLVETIEDDENVFDGQAGADIAPAVLKQIILERAWHD